MLTKEDNQAIQSTSQTEPSFNDDETVNTVIQGYGCAAVQGIAFHQCQDFHASTAISQHPDATNTNIRGVKAGLRSHKKQMTNQEFHDDYGHLGCVGPCTICTLAHGCRRRITKAVDAYNEIRRAHTWDGDILTWEHRSECGCKYQIVLRCRMSKATKFIFLRTRDEAPEAIKQWIIRNRSKPEFQNMEYKFCSILHLDRAGEWGEDSKEWDTISIELKF